MLTIPVLNTIFEEPSASSEHTLKAASTSAFFLPSEGEDAVLPPTEGTDKHSKHSMLCS
jgi:hypothetical protein